MTHIDAMKQALEKIANVSAMDYEYQRWAREALTIAQPEQEPQSVRERWNIERDGDDLLVCFNDHNKSQACAYTRYVPASQRTEHETVIDKSAAIRIATALGWEPSREWVGLTDEDIDEWTPEIHVVIKAIEVKLKHNNGY